MGRKKKEEEDSKRRKELKKLGNSLSSSLTEVWRWSKLASSSSPHQVTVQFNWPMTVTCNWYMTLLRQRHNSVGRKPACRRETRFSPMMGHVPVLGEYVSCSGAKLCHSNCAFICQPPFSVTSPSWSVICPTQLLRTEGRVSQPDLRFGAEMRWCTFLILRTVLPHPHTLPRVCLTCKCESSECVTFKLQMIP